jgi:hypothetical protein
MNKRRPLRTVGLLVFLFSGIAGAQVSTGTISGTVKDSSGAVLPAAKVVILNEDTGISRTLDADENGHYAALSLSLGNYQVTGMKEGFQTEVRTGIVLTVGRQEVVDLSLSVGAVAQSVEVRGSAPLVDSTTATLGSLVDDRTIRELPLNGRSYDQLALLQPGVTLTSPGKTSSTAYTFGTGARFSVGGQLPNSNLFLLDGTNINDQANGTPGGAAGTNLGVDTILEFKIFTSLYKAEFGHSTGSVTTAVTRSGTNSFHGTAFEYIRNHVLDAKNFFDVGSAPPPFIRNQFGGVIGGPIKKDKTFFFAGYEGLRQGLGTTQIATVPTVLARQGILPTGKVTVNPAVVPFLDLYPLPNGRDFGDGSAEFLSSPTAVTNEDNVMGRIDHQLNDKTSIFGRYVFDQDSVNAPLNLPDQVQVIGTRRQYATLQLKNILGANALNEFRFAFNRTHSAFDQVTTPDPGPQVSLIPGQPLGGLAVGGIVTSSGSRAITPLGPTAGQGAFLWAWNILQFGDDFNYVKGKHTFKTGVDVQRLQDNTTNTGFLRGNYTFTTFPNFLTGTASSLQAAAPLGVTPEWGIRQTLVAVYGQDDFAVTSRLTLNLGLRWEAPTDPIDVNGKTSILPSFASTSMAVWPSFFGVGKKNFEPRFGLAWQLNASGKTVLRLGAGIYHDQILPWLFAQQTRTPPFFASFLATNPPFPNGYQILGPGAPIALNVMAPFNKTLVDDQYSVSIEQQLSRNTVLEVSYVGNHANHIGLSIEEDTPIPTTCSTALHNCPAGLPDGTTFYPANAPRRNTAWAGEKVIQNVGNSDYNALTVTLRRQFANGFQGQIFYTYAKALDEGTSISGAESTRSPGSIMDPEDPSRDWGLSDFDARHSIVGNFVYAIPFRSGSRVLEALAGGWTLNGISTFRSGMPFTAILSTSVSRNKATNGLADRPNLNPGFSSSPNHGVSAGCPGFAVGTKVGGAANFFDPCAFSSPAAGTYGDVRRNSIIGPGTAAVDLALSKTFKTTETTTLTFRVEAFNIMNHANFGLPNGAALAANGTANPAAGRITYTTTSSRQIQFALRFNF